MAFVNLFKQLLVFIVNENALKLREKVCYRLHIPIYLMLVHALLSKGSGAHKPNLNSIRNKLISPLRTMILIPFDQILRNI